MYADKCHFSFSFITAITHDDPNNLELHDEPLFNALERMKRNGVFENTAIVVMGDHGQRIVSLTFSFPH
jgi:membrane-anchored protein YejM (alkaline phosphatase superfamily)